MRIKLGETANYQLEGKPATGYSWQYAVEQTGIVTIEEKLSSVNTALLGGNAVFNFTIKAIELGTTAIVFNYARPWEQAKHPIKTKRLTLEVVQ
jgi:predicted secreted protein